MENLSSKLDVKAPNNWRTDKRRGWENPHRAGGIGGVGAALQAVRDDAVWRQRDEKQDPPLLMENQRRGTPSKD